MPGTRLGCAPARHPSSLVLGFDLALPSLASHCPPHLRSYPFICRCCCAFVCTTAWHIGPLARWRPAATTPPFAAATPVSPWSLAHPYPLLHLGCRIALTRHARTRLRWRSPAHPDPQHCLGSPMAHGHTHTVYPYRLHIPNIPPLQCASCSCSFTVLCPHPSVPEPLPTCAPTIRPLKILLPEIADPSLGLPPSGPSIRPPVLLLDICSYHTLGP